MNVLLILKDFCRLLTGIGGVKCIGVSKLSLLRCLHVRGTNNIIEIHSRLSKNVQIYIYGNNNHLVIGHNVTFKKGVVWF